MATNAKPETTTEREIPTRPGHATYELKGDVPDALKGTFYFTREADSLESFRDLVQDGDEKHIVKLAQSAYDIIVQRVLRNASNSEEVGKMLEEGDVEGAMAHLQGLADEYRYGARISTGGTGAKVKAKAQQLDKVAEAAANDPELAAKLAALGISIG